MLSKLNKAYLSVYYNLFKSDLRNLDTPDSDFADKWRHRRKMLEEFLSALLLSSNMTLTGAKKFTLLLHNVSTPIYWNLSECENYETAVEILEAMFVKKNNTIFARHLLATRHQQPEESLEKYLQILKTLGHEYEFTVLTTNQAGDIFIRDAFINGIQSNLIKQRLRLAKSLWTSPNIGHGTKTICLLFTARDFSGCNFYPASFSKFFCSVFLKFSIFSPPLQDQNYSIVQDTPALLSIMNNVLLWPQLCPSATFVISVK